MPLLTNLTVVRAILNRDRDWAAYAIGDLDPGLVEHCEWIASVNDPQALLLVYRGFDPPIVFAMGPDQALAALWPEVSASAISLHVRPDAIAPMTPVFAPQQLRVMHRMRLKPEAFTPATLDGIAILRDTDRVAVEALYRDGEPRGEAPTFFHASMLGQGTFRGVWERGQLVAIAGTHLYSRAEGVCTVGNVYTHSDHRGRGLAARVTSAVVAHALGEGVPTIVLNVGEHNAAARRVYERLGFDHYGEFFEGEATRRAP